MVIDHRSPTSNLSPEGAGVFENSILVCCSPADHDWTKVNRSVSNGALEMHTSNSEPEQDVQRGRKVAAKSMSQKGQELIG